MSSCIQNSTFQTKSKPHIKNKEYCLKQNISYNYLVLLDI